MVDNEDFCIYCGDKLFNDEEEYCTFCGLWGYCD